MNTMDGMDETEIIPLHKSVKVGEITYETLTLREPTAGQLEKASQATTQIGVAISLIALVAKVPRAVIEHLCQRDLKTISDFLGRSARMPPKPRRCRCRTDEVLWLGATHGVVADGERIDLVVDRKSTRLNSSHQI